MGMYGKTFRVADRASAEPGPSLAVDIGFGFSSLCVLYHACCAQSVAASDSFASQKLRLLPPFSCVLHKTDASPWLRAMLYRDGILGMPWVMDQAAMCLLMARQIQNAGMC